MSVAAVAFMAANGRFRGIVIDDGGSISSDNGSFTTDGAGNLTVNSLTSTVGMSGGKVQITATTSAQSLATGNTITLPANTGALLLTNAGAVTGIIMPTLAISLDQEVWLINTSANSITFAASGTSHVADGASDVIAANSAAKMIWDHTQSLWYRA